MKKESKMLVGIDFGTCRSSAAVLINGEPHSVSLGYNTQGKCYDIPTAVFVEQDGTILVGDDAVNSRAKNLDRFVDQFKLRIGGTRGRTFTVSGEERTYKWAEFVAAVLRRIRTAAQTQFNNGQPLYDAVITVPALYASNGPQWLAMEEAGAIAGFEKVRLLREPQAAAAYFDHLMRTSGQDAEDGKVTLVYDLGGGTFDPALIRRRADGYEILGAITGNAGVECGGIFFDERLRADFKDKCPGAISAMATFQRDATGSVALEDMPKLKDWARQEIALVEFLTETKHRFADVSISVVEQPEPITFAEDYRLERGDFYSLIDSMLTSTIACCTSLISSSGLEWKDVSRVLMVGGSCHIPLVREKLEAVCRDKGASTTEICWRRIGKSDVLFDPLLAVSLGASLALDPAVVNELAEDYLLGRGVPKNEELAFSHFQKSARQGNAAAQANIGRCFALGLGTPIDRESALSWFEKSADSGNEWGEYYLGVCAYLGFGVGKDNGRAFRHFLRAAEKGCVKAICNLGLCYLYGYGVDRDISLALHWLQKAAAQGDEKAAGAVRHIEATSFLLYPTD